MSSSRFTRPAISFDVGDSRDLRPRLRRRCRGEDGCCRHHAAAEQHRSIHGDVRRSFRRPGGLVGGGGSGRSRGRRWRADRRRGVDARCARRRRVVCVRRRARAIRVSDRDRRPVRSDTRPCRGAPDSRRRRQRTRCRHQPRGWPDDRVRRERRSRRPRFLPRRRRLDQPVRRGAAGRGHRRGTSERHLHRREPGRAHLVQPPHLRRADPASLVRRAPGLGIRRRRTGYDALVHRVGERRRQRLAGRRMDHRADAPRRRSRSLHPVVAGRPAMDVTRGAHGVRDVRRDRHRRHDGQRRADRGPGDPVRQRR